LEIAAWSSRRAPCVGYRTDATMWTYATSESFED
jgi:hypothetical protein